MSAWAILDHMRGRCTRRFFGSCAAGSPSPNPRTWPNGGRPHTDETVSLVMAHGAIDARSLVRGASAQPTLSWRRVLLRSGEEAIAARRPATGPWVREPVVRTLCPAAARGAKQILLRQQNWRAPTCKSQ